MNNSLTNEQKEVYRKSFLEHGDTPKGVFWNNRDTQYLRFERLLKNFDISMPFSIHDIGCGTCSLHEYLLDKQIKHDYHGTEIVSEMIETSKNKFPEVALFNRDILAEKHIETCDIGIVSGAFYLSGNANKEKWKEYVWMMMNKLFSVTSQGVAFNFLTTYKTFSDPSLSYFDPKEVFDYCIKQLSRFVIIDHAYPLYEFTVTVFKEDYLKAKYSSPAYEKYFSK